MSLFSYKKNKKKSDAWVKIAMFLVAAFMLLPFCWIISTSLRLPKESFSLPPSFFPTSFHIENYKRVFTELPFFNFIFNSIKITIVVTVGQSIVTSLAAYAFSRIKFKGRNVLFIIMLSGIMIPYQSTIIPKFLFVKALGIMDTHLALILPALIHPLGIFLVRQFMLTIPKSYDEAAYIDGATRFRIYWNILLPMSIPSIIVVSIMSFIMMWNDFMNPLIFISTYEKMTLPLGLTVLKGYMGTGSVSAILAGVSISLITPLLIYIFGQKYLMQGSALSGIKG